LPRCFPETTSRPSDSLNDIPSRSCWHETFSYNFHVRLICLIAVSKVLMQPFHASCCRLSKQAGEELTSLQASNFSSTGDISAHASGVRVLVLRVLRAAVSLTKAKNSKQKDQVSTHTLMLPCLQLSYLCRLYPTAVLISACFD